jgi:type IV pilus assembly protein PilB
MLDLTSLNIPPEVLSLIPKDVAVNCRVVPLSMKGEAVRIAVPLGCDVQTIDDISFFLGRDVVPEKVPAEDIIEALQHFYDISEIDLAKSQTNNANQSQSPANAGDTDGEPLTEVARRGEASTDGSTVATVDRIITQAVRMKASDIHVEPYEKFMRVRYRLDGVLHEVEQLPIERSKPIISRLKIMSELDIAEKRRPQDGRIRVNEDGRTIDIRVSTLPTDFGEKVVLRILDKSQLQLDLSRLGFEPEDLNIFQRTIRLPFGMILVTGPTGSGKTTTLYAALQQINDPRVNITTIEDPIEYNLAGVNQTQVRSEIGVTFSAALRSILRQDPNVIMIGEIRDSETAEIAIRAALTGHLVFSTLHTNDAPSAVTRLIDMGVEPFLVASSIKMIIAQRLLRKLCPRCRKGYQPSPEELGEMQIQDSIHGKFYKPGGCPSCNSVGYKGRSAVYEMLSVQDALSDMIAHNASASDIRRTAKEGGLHTLRQAALKKAVRGETSLEEVIRETAV